MNTVRIPMQDLIELPVTHTQFRYEQRVLQMLQKKGLPIKGKIYFKLDSDYNWQTYDDIRTMEKVIQFKKI